MLKVAIPISFKDDRWIGGVNYFRSLLFFTNRYADARYQIVLLTDRPKFFEDVVGEFGKVEFCEAWNWKSGMYPAISKVTKKLGGYDLALLRKLRREKFNLISHGHAGLQRQIPTLVWVPDFQHRALPHLFSQAQLSRRDRNVAESRYFGRLLVSSVSAMEDFLRYYPFSKDVQVSVLRFCSMATSVKPITVSRDAICTKYEIPDRYFYVPNQFWEHKNHRVLLEALHCTANDLTIVCSGKTEDFRNVNYFHDLMDQAKKLGVTAKFRVLGLIPYEDVAVLSHYAMAIINPSLFEGWSTSVEEAKAVGKRVVLSSIPVHIEQAPKRALYFSPDDATELAALLDKVHEEWNEADETEQMSAASALHLGFQRTFIDEYASIIERCVNSDDVRA